MMHWNDFKFNYLDHFKIKTQHCKREVFYNSYQKIASTFLKILTKFLNLVLTLMKKITGFKAIWTATLECLIKKAQETCWEIIIANSINQQALAQAISRQLIIQSKEVHNLNIKIIRNISIL